MFGLVLRPSAVRAALRNGPKRVAGRRCARLVLFSLLPHCLLVLCILTHRLPRMKQKAMRETSHPLVIVEVSRPGVLPRYGKLLVGVTIDVARQEQKSAGCRSHEPRTNLIRRHLRCCRCGTKMQCWGGAVGSVVVAQILLWSGRSCRGNTHSRFAKNFLARLLCTSFICGSNYISPPPFVLLCLHHGSIRERNA